MYLSPRQYWMIYRGPGFLSVEWFGSSPAPFFPHSRQQVVSLSQSSCVSPVELTDGREWARRRITWPRESLNLYKSFHTLFLPTWTERAGKAFLRGGAPTGSTPSYPVRTIKFREGLLIQISIRWSWRITIRIRIRNTYTDRDTDPVTDRL